MSKKPIGPSCSNCGLAAVTLLTCGRCRLSQYCGKDCQKQHWKSEHKKFCLSPEERKPQHYSGARCSVAGKCAICLDLLSSAMLSKLPCSHVFHVSCVTELRLFGVSHLCPLCRADLPPGPERVCEEATRLFVELNRRNRGLHPSEMDQGMVKELNSILKMWRESADQGYAAAQCCVGYVYDNGLGLQQSDFEAAQWYLKAGDQGNAVANFNLGIMHSEGRGVEQCKQMSAKRYQMAANHGHVQAQFNLGVAYEKGEGVRQSYGDAFHWHQIAASHGNAEAQFNLCIMYAKGQGVIQNYHLAAQWCHKAANQGITKALFNLGAMYHAGQGVKQSYCEAAQLYRKAADKGDAQAQYNLALMHLSGNGVKQSYDEAVRWCRISADQGDENAEKLMRVMQSMSHQERETCGGGPS